VVDEQTMKDLQQAVYEDDNGNPVDAEKVDCLAPYNHVCDGFYNWSCGACGHEHSDRWWSISGRVMVCQQCKKKNLLVRTNTKEITEALQGKWKSAEMEAENERLKGIIKYNVEQIRGFQQIILNAVNTASTAAVHKAEKGE
jgi:hypothetical protein